MEEEEARRKLDWRVAWLVAIASVLAGLIAGSFSLVGLAIQNGNDRDRDIAEAARQHDRDLEEASRQQDRDLEEAKQLREQRLWEFTYQRRRGAYYRFRLAQSECLEGAAPEINAVVKSVVGTKVRKTKNGDFSGTSYQGYRYDRLPDALLRRFADHLLGCGWKLATRATEVDLVGSRAARRAAAAAVNDAQRMATRAERVWRAKSRAEYDDAMNELFWRHFIHVGRYSKDGASRFVRAARRDLTAP
jgi:hypothetical protein